MSDVSKVEEIYLAAVEQPDSNQRAKYLDGVCGDDADLRRHVETLLAAHPHADGFLEPVDPGKTHDYIPPETQAIGTMIANRYSLVEVIGEGGMGTVWRAKQTEPVKRYVALKLIKLGMDSKQVLARFEAERQALAMMDHPNIARILDGGIHDNRPFFVMELVKGTPITEFCDARKLTPQQRLELFLPVCQAIQHAHQKGIIHRDIKPSNVLIALYDDKPVPKVIDFGVAKATGGALTQHTIDTGFGGVVGTPQYMSPEQATFNNLDIDTRSDVYSLGTLLYELLAGSPPFAQPELEKRGLLEMLRVVREEEPPRPSLKLSTAEARASISANRGSEPAQLSSMMKGEIDWIVMKALEKDRSRRYDTATALAKDVQRYLNGDAVEACPPTLGYRFSKFSRKYKKSIAISALFISLLTTGSVLTGLLAVWARSAEREANQQRIASDEAKREAIEAKLEADSQRDKVLMTAYVSDMNLAARAWEDNNLPRARELLQRVPELVAGQELRGFEWHYLSRVCNSALRTLNGHSGAVLCAAFSPDGKRLATGSSDTTVKVWSCETGKELFSFEGPGGPVRCLDFSPDGQRLASSDGNVGLVTVSDSSTGLLLSQVKHKAQVHGIDFSPDGQCFATAGNDGTVKVWDSTTSKELVSLDHGGQYLFTVAFSPDGQRLASAGRWGTIKIWDVATSKELLTLTGHTSTIWSVAFSPDGRQLASGSNDNTVKLWGTENGNELLTVTSTIGCIYSVSYSPDGKRLAGGGDKKLVKIWDTNTGEELASIRGHGDQVHCVRFSRDGRRLASASNDQTAKIWDSEAHNEPLTLAGFGSVASSQDGRHVVKMGAEKNTIDVLDGTTGQVSRTLKSETPVSNHLAISPDGRYVASRSKVRTENGQLKVWNAAAEKELFLVEGHVDCLSFCPDGRLLATAQGSTVSFWEIPTGQKCSEFDADDFSVDSLAYSPNARQLATGHEFSEVKIWDSATHENLFTLTGHTSAVSCVVYNPNGLLLASASFDETVKIWDVTKGSELFSLKGHSGPVRSVVFHPNGTRLATASDDETVKIWDSMTGEELISLVDTGSRDSSISFSPDGRCLISEHSDGTINIWGTHASLPIGYKPSH